MMKLDGMTCPSCLTKIKKAVESTPGTDDIKVLFNAGKLKFVMDPAQTNSNEIKNAIEDYSKDTTVPGSKRMYESQLEGGAQAIGTKVINKYANAVCRKLTQSATGGYTCYVAIHVLLTDANKGLAEELEVRKVDYDKKKFFEKMDAELAKEAERKQAEMDAMQ